MSRTKERVASRAVSGIAGRECGRHWIIPGAGELIGYVLRLASGTAADRTQRYWTLVIAGYFINVSAVPLMAVANHWRITAALIIAERAGARQRATCCPKRPRSSDAAGGLDYTSTWTSLEVPGSVNRGASNEGKGALLGRLCVACDPGGLGYGFHVYGDQVLSRFIAFWGFENARSRRQEVAARVLDFRDCRGICGGWCCRLPAYSVSFLQNIAGLDRCDSSLLYGIAMGVEGLMALLFGKLFDLVGTGAMIVGVLLSAASTPLVFFGSMYATLAGMALWGAGMVAQQATLRGRIADLVPAAKQGSAYGIFNTVFGILWFAGSSAVGILYGRSLLAAVVFASAAQLAVIPLLLTVGRKAA
jgi:hypothetical protein